MGFQNPSLTAFCAIFLLSVPAFSLDFWSEGPSQEIAAQIAARMTAEELAGQVLMIGYLGDSVSSATWDWVARKGAGGIKIFGWNANDLKKLVLSIRTLQSATQENRFKIPLLIATDQEGGWVRHIRGSTSQTPGNLAIGSSGLPYDAFKTGFYIGEELKALGINMNFAPTVDIYTNKEAHVIGPRAFSSDPVQVAVMSVAFYKGLEQARVIATAKHFPGHGNASEDSHGRLPEIRGNYEDLKHRELIPYAYLIKEGIPAIMSGHLWFPEITGKAEPASLSPFFVEKVLRNDLAYTRLVITDDLFMEGARPDSLGFDEAVEKSLRAGNDMALLSQPAAAQEAAWKRLAEKAKKDPSFEKRLRSAAQTIIRIKLEYLKGTGSVPLTPSLTGLAARIPDPEGRGFFFEQAARSVAVVKKDRIPLPTGQEVLVIGPYEGFFEAFRERFGQARFLPYGYNPFFQFEKSVRDRMLLDAASAKTIVFNLVTPGSLFLLKALEPFKQKLTVVSLLTPIYLRETPWVSSAIAAYGANRDSFEAAVAVLAGDFVPTGKVPLPLEP